LQSKFQILFSGSQTESAKILSALASKESRKGYVLPYPLRLSASSEKVFPFFQSLPGIGFGTALLLASQFKSAKDVVTAAQVNTYCCGCVVHVSVIEAFVSSVDISIIDA
jgi:ERCC4-type nuclease